MGVPLPGLPPTRRAGGARHEVSDRVFFYDGEREISGWALNLSRGGVRAIVEEPVELGGEYTIAVGDSPRRPCRVVWIQEEPDGAIVGVSFLDATLGDSEPPPPPPAAPPAGTEG